MNVWPTSRLRKVGNRTRELCEPYWRQWGIVTEGSAESWFGSPEGIMCEVMFVLILLAVCVFCCWDAIKETMVEREELAEEAMKDMEEILMKMQPQLKETAEKCTTAAASLRLEAKRASIQAAQTAQTFVASPHLAEEVDSSDDEENDRMTVASLQWMSAMPWSSKTEAREQAIR
ncbi:unnamed protein product [Durusdinium trenchii]|uniref:Uncharacterized protein n=1 Tax=Durusdinium trenchii TaxID=1381693 RepID=A0ABP0HS01_9DINO